jgi:predicted 3-demethylubiquinone-9 3-methyltransferase (glyoxalase superfamily)
MNGRISPFLWFDYDAEEAARFYTSIFENSRIGSVTCYGDAGPGPKGSAMSVTFELDGQECRTQAEVDHFWEKLSEGGRIQQCGWLQDRYGVSWQIVPTVLGDMLGDKDPEKARGVMHAMLQMKKLDIEGLERAYRSPA